MSVEESKAVIRAFGEAMSSKDAAFLDAHPGLDGQKALLKQLWVAFPDLQRTSQGIVAEGGWAVERLLVSGTMQGTFMGMAPTGKHATWEVIGMMRVSAGKIVEYHAQADAMAMMQQLGIGPAGAPTPR